MDPATVIVVLAAHLLGTSALMFLVRRQMPPRCGAGPWAAGLALFGGAYLVRLAIGLSAISVVALGADLAMMLAALLFNVGLRQFVAGPPIAWRRAALLLGGFAAVEVVAMLRYGPQGRHVALNLCLGTLYAWLGLSAWAARRLVGERLQRPLWVVTGLMVVQALMTLARGLHIGVEGPGAAYGGLFPQFFYGYSALAAVLLAMGLLWMLFTRLTGQLADLATHDPLTRVLNRAGLDEVLKRHFGDRRAAPLVVLAVDIDHFKAINDQHGHASGDEVLRMVADTLSAHVRPNDVVARTGGEEFAVCCPGVDRAAALVLAERLRAAIAARTVPLPGGPLHSTVSIGVSAPCATRADVERAAGEADRALYAAKAGGRNRVAAAT